MHRSQSLKVKSMISVLCLRHPGCQRARESASARICYLITIGWRDLYGFLETIFNSSEALNTSLQGVLKQSKFKNEGSYPQDILETRIKQASASSNPSYHKGLKQQGGINLRRDWHKAVGSRRAHEGNENHSGQRVTRGRR